MQKVYHIQLSIVNGTASPVPKPQERKTFSSPAWKDGGFRKSHLYEAAFEQTISHATDLLAFAGDGRDEVKKEFTPFEIYEIRGKANRDLGKPLKAISYLELAEKSLSDAESVKCGISRTFSTKHICTWIMAHYRQKETTSC